MAVKINYDGSTLATVTSSAARLNCAGKVMRSKVDLELDSPGSVIYNNAVTAIPLGAASLDCMGMSMRSNVIVSPTVDANLIYSFTGSDFRKASITVGAGPYGTGNTIKYTNTDATNRLIIGNKGHNPLLAVPAGHKLTIKLTASISATLQGAIWFILPSGVSKIAEGTQQLVGTTDLIDTGWMNSGASYNVPANTQYIWINARRTDNAQVYTSDISSFKIYATPIT